MKSTRECPERWSSAASGHWPHIAAVALLLGACGDAPTEPPVELTINTMAIEVSGAIELDEVVPAFGGFQSVTTGEGTGIHIYADPGGLPFAIHLPGRPEVGESVLGRWDPLSDFLREGGVLTADPREFVRQDPIQNVGRKPSVSFGDHPAAALDAYASLDGGTVEIDAVTLPGPRDFTDNDAVPGGSVRGRIHTRAAVDPRLVPPGMPVEPDTVEISVEFRVELENWRDGRGTANFTDGALAGVSAPFLVGSGSAWWVGTDPDDYLLVALAGDVGDSGDRLDIWFGTKLDGPGSATLEVVDPETVVFIQPFEWPDHFVAAVINGSDGDRLGSLSGTIELDDYEKYDGRRWGEAEGRITVELGLQGSSGDGELERTTAEITFDVPVGFRVDYCTPTGPPCSADALLAPRSSSVGWRSARSGS